MSENKSGIMPMEYQVLVEPVRVEERTAGGLYIPDDRREKDQHATQEGTLIAVSPLAFGYAEWPEGARKPEIGDRVLFPKYEAQKFGGADGQDYWLMPDVAIKAIKEA